LTSEYPER
jgi:hypothetical protein